MTAGVFGDLASSSIYQAMQGLWAQQQASAQNLANVNTPGYKAETVNFESSLAQAAADGDPSAMQVTTAQSTAPADQVGNNVDMGQELITEQKASLQFQTMVQAMNAKFQLLSTAINGPSNS